jgi:3-hydroxyacyl-[acyl-carrier-protein] dehydratase
VTAPNAAPLRAADRIEVVAGDVLRGDVLTVRATKLVDPRDPYLPGHFPGLTLYPGVFLLETLRQTVVAVLGEDGGGLPELTWLRSLRCLAPLRAGEWFTLTCTLARHDGGHRADGRFVRGDGVRAATVRADYGYPGGDRAGAR